MPFSGLKVIDCASFIAAPAAATILSDYGADVIKIEPPEGDAYRELYRAPGMTPGERNFPWELDSRNKRSLVLDLKRPEAAVVMRRLIDSADVFITNLPLPARRRLNLHYEAIGPMNPRLIYGSFTAYGEAGPEADKTGFDSTAYWARSGLMDLVRADHLSTPARSVAGQGDHPSATSLYAAIVTALFLRERTGLGGQVSASLLGNGLWANSYFVQAKLCDQPPPPRLPRELAPNACGNIYCCRDGRWLSLTVLNEARQFGPLLDVLGCPEVAHDPRFIDNPARRVNSHELVKIFDRQFLLRDLADWRQRLDAVGITFGVIGTLDDIPGDEQMRASGAIVPFADGSGLTVSSPFAIDGITKVSPGRAPGLGEHSDQVLREYGFDDAEIGRLREQNVLG